MKKWSWVFIAIILIVFLILINNKNRNSNSGSSPRVQKNFPTLAWPAELPADATVEPLERRSAKNYYIVFDGSGSMESMECADNQKKITVAKKAVQEFAAKIPNDANIGLAVFDGQGLSERLPLGTENRPQFFSQIDGISANGGTPLKSAVSLASKKLAQQAARQMGYGEYHLVIVTDGDPSEGEDPRPAVEALLANSPTLLHTIGFCIGENHALNQKGRVFYVSATSPEELRQGLTEVLAEATSFNLDGFVKTQH